MRKLFAALIGIIMLTGVGYYYFASLSKGSPACVSSDFSTSTSDVVFSGAPLFSDPQLLFSLSDASLTGASAPSRQIPIGVKEFRSPPLHFSILYPQAMAVQVYKEEGNALTATFEDDAIDKEFEVFAAPYEGQQITTQRFKMDEPSGVYKEPHEVLIDGVCATAFVGIYGRYQELVIRNNDIMGDTSEVWFIHGDIFTRLRHTRSSIRGLRGLCRRGNSFEMV